MVLIQEVKEPFVAVPEGEKQYFVFIIFRHFQKYVKVSAVICVVMQMMWSDMYGPQHGVRFPHSLRQQVLPDLLLDQQLVDFSPPVERSSQKKILLYACNDYMQNEAKTGNLMLQKKAEYGTCDSPLHH